MAQKLQRRRYLRALKRKIWRNRKQLNQRPNPLGTVDAASWPGLEMLEPRMLLSGDSIVLESLVGSTDINAPIAAQVVVTNEAAATSTAIGESGTVAVEQLNARQWHTVTLNRSYTAPVVVMGPLSFNGSESGNTRVRNITQTSFEWQVDEWDYLGGHHKIETIGYLVVESGTHKLENGAVLVAGTTSTNHNFRSVDLTSFDSTPIVLTQVSSAVGSSAVVTRLKNVTKNGFEVRVQEEEGNDKIHAVEVISYVAIETGNGSTDSLTFEAAKTSNSVTHRTKSVSFDGNFTSTPIFLANIQTFDGSDTAGLRYRSLNSDGASFFIEEEQSANKEKRHTTEIVGYLAINSGLINSYDDQNKPSDDGDQLPGVVLRAGGELEFSGENDDYMQIEHHSDLALANGSVAFSFTPDHVSGWHAR